MAAKPVGHTNAVPHQCLTSSKAHIGLVRRCRPPAVRPRLAVAADARGELLCVRQVRALLDWLASADILGTPGTARGWLKYRAG